MAPEREHIDVRVRLEAGTDGEAPAVDTAIFDHICADGDVESVTEPVSQDIADLFREVFDEPISEYGVKSEKFE